jgi:hypothetical protein
MFVQNAFMYFIMLKGSMTVGQSYHVNYTIKNFKPKQSVSLLYQAKNVNLKLYSPTKYLWVRPDAYPRVEHLKGASPWLVQA